MGHKNLKFPCGIIILIASTLTKSGTTDSTAQQINFFQWLLDNCEDFTWQDLPKTGMAHFVRVICAFLGSIQPWLATLSRWKLYKVDSLAVVTRHGPKPDSHEGEAEAFTKLEAEALTHIRSRSLSYEKDWLQN